MSEELFQQYLIILSFSLIGAVIFRRLGMATIVAYMAIGVLVGPYVLGFIDTPAQFSLLAEFGVVFLLFNLGLEFSLKKMMAMRFAVFGVGGFQVITCTLVFATTVYFWGAPFSTAFMIAGTLALSSTAIVTRELLANRQLHNLHGQLSVGVLLFQDLVAVVFLVLVPVLGGSQDASLSGSLIQAAFSAVILLVILLVAGKWILPVIYREVAKSQSNEIFVLSTLVIVLLAAWLTHSFHLSMALGAFVTGMMLGEGPFKYQVETDIRPFKDILLGLFFVTIGMGLDVSLLLIYWPRILIFTIGLIVIKTILVGLVVRLLKYSSYDALSVGLNLAQAGEFGLALMALATINGIVPTEQASFIILIITFSMVASPFLIRHANWISKKFLKDQQKETKKNPVKLHLEEHVILGGFGRLGSTLSTFLESNDVPYIAIEKNIDLVDKYRKQGKNIIYGDSNNIEILNLCHLDSARLIVLTFKSLEEGKVAIEGIRQRNTSVPIIVRCQDHHGLDELMLLGADHVYPELLESSLLISRHVLGLLSIDEQEITKQIEDYRLSPPI